MVKEALGDESGGGGGVWVPCGTHNTEEMVAVFWSYYENERLQIPDYKFDYKSNFM